MIMMLDIALLGFALGFFQIPNLQPPSAAADFHSSGLGLHKSNNINDFLRLWSELIMVIKSFGL